MESSTLKIATELHDTMRKGIPTAMEDVSLSLHPIDHLQKTREERDAKWRTRELASQYGMGEAMKYNADETLLKRFHRFPGLLSSNFGLDVYKGKHLTLDVEDWLGDRELKKQHFCNFHATMEHNLKM